MRYADQMYLDAQKVDAAFYDELKKHFRPEFEHFIEHKTPLVKTAA